MKKKYEVTIHTNHKVWFNDRFDSIELARWAVVKWLADETNNSDDVHIVLEAIVWPELKELTAKDNE